MKHIVLTIASSFIFLLTANAQQAFRYDTIRTNTPANRNTPQSPVYGEPSFRYDTIRSSNSSTQNRYGNQRVTNSSASKSKSSIPTQTKSSFDKNKLFFGGNLGLQFGDYTLVDISPQVGYAFNQYFAAGLGLTYTYLNSDYYNYEYSRSYAGINLFAQVYPIRNIILAVQPEANYLWGKDKYPGYEVSDNRFVPALVIGAGVRFPVGNVGGMVMMLQYDVIQDDYSPYGNNVFYTVGYTFGF